MQREDWQASNFGINGFNLFRWVAFFFELDEYPVCVVCFCADHASSSAHSVCVAVKLCRSRCGERRHGKQDAKGREGQ